MRRPKSLCDVVEFQLNPAQAPEGALPFLAHLHAGKFLSVSLGTGVSEDSFLSALHGSFLREWGFNIEILAGAMVEVRHRAFSKLDDKLSFGPQAPPQG